MVASKAVQWRGSRCGTTGRRIRAQRKRHATRPVAAGTGPSHRSRDSHHTRLAGPNAQCSSPGAVSRRQTMSSACASTGAKPWLPRRTTRRTRFEPPRHRPQQRPRSRRRAKRQLRPVREHVSAEKDHDSDGSPECGRWDLGSKNRRLLTSGYGEQTGTADDFQARPDRPLMEQREYERGDENGDKRATEGS
jgi:hypothetical protein